MVLAKRTNGVKKPARKATKKARKTAANKGAAKSAAKDVAKRGGPRKSASTKGAKKAAPFGRQGTAGRGEGRGAVEAWIKAVKPRHKPIVLRIDQIVAEEVPDTRYAIKWSTPLFGRAGIGWYAAVASFKEHVAVNFFNGVALTPQPPAGSSKQMRSVKLASLDDLDEKQLRAWLRQASTIKGWGKV